MPARWQRIEDLFEAAAARDPADRHRFLARACGDDENLKTELEALLDHDREAAGLLGDLPAGADTEAAGNDPMLGRLLGTYRLERRIGSGGTSTVYLARRADHQFQMRVAVKILRFAWASDDLLRRFRIERQILASLEHPNIARLLDGGTTDDGVPYVVIELVEGQPIDAYCARHDLRLAERLELFRTVCGAVHHAHQKLIVHRDLKPSNILVTREGVPKLLDFGIAKLLSPEVYDDGAVPTATSQRLMTPGYASPEQVRGEPVSTTADVYALGVLLYRLLTGGLPYRLADREPTGILHAFASQKPDVPSVAVARPPDQETDAIGKADPQRRRLAHQLSGDLDAIVMTAIRQEPRRRYGSVERLADDIDRHLRGQPVRARPDTWGYRTRSWLSRHRLLATLASALLVAMLGFGVLTGRYASRLAEERDLARQQHDKAQLALDLVIELFEAADPEQNGETLTARALLEQGARRMESALREHPKAGAQILDTIGRVETRLGLYDSAIDRLERALATRRSLLGESHPKVASEDLIRRVLDLRRRWPGDRHADLPTGLYNLGNLYYFRGELDLAEPLFREAHARLVALLGNDHTQTVAPLFGLGRLLAARGDASESAAYLRRALDVWREHLDADHWWIARAESVLGECLAQLGRFDEAEALLERSFPIIEAQRGSQDIETRAARERLERLEELRAMGPPPVRPIRIPESLESHTVP